MQVRPNFYLDRMFRWHGNINALQQMWSHPVFFQSYSSVPIPHNPFSDLYKIVLVIHRQEPMRMDFRLQSRATPAGNVPTDD